MVNERSEISQAAVDEIVTEEVSSPSVYEKKYRRPEWPGAQSGVTIGCGYDVGQNSEAQFRNDWAGVIPDAMVDALAGTCGITGEAAAPHAQRLKAIVDVPWSAATEVFEKRTCPRYIALTKRYLPNWDNLSPDSKGALVSLVFNRGASFTKDGDRYREMRNIRQHMIDQRFDLIPAEFRDMKRIWVGQGVDGLLARRDREAALFERGLQSSPQPAPAPLPPATQSAPAQPREHHQTLGEQITDAFWRLFSWKK